jgi:hypothetical protein
VIVIIQKKRILRINGIHVKLSDPEMFALEELCNAEALSLSEGIRQCLRESFRQHGLLLHQICISKNDDGGSNAKTE